MLRKMMTIKQYILFILLLTAGRLYAQDVKFSASANKTEVGTGEEFVVTFSVNANADRFAPPDFGSFEVLSGPNVSSSMTSINGNMTVSSSYSYYLMAAKEGSYTIGPASVNVNGRTLKTNALRITVVKGRPVQQNTQRSSSEPDQSLVESRPANLADALFIRAVTDKASVYQGEQITLTYRLYTRVALVGSQVEKIPDLNGFWSEELGNSRQNAEWRTETYKGVQYNVADVKQAILFPEHSGNLTIDPLEMTFIVRQAAPARTLMDEFFGSYEDVKRRVKSVPVTIRVKPLPQAGRPAGFSGAVGDFSVEAAIDRNELKANEALNYTLKISGKGNLKLLKAPAMDFPADFEKYDPKLTDAISVNSSGVSGNRTYNYLLIPRHNGNFTIAPAVFSWFDPAKGRYFSTSAKSFTIHVLKGAPGGNVVAYSGAGKQDVKLLNQDIRYIHTSLDDLYKEGEEFYGSAGYYLLLLMGPFLFTGGLIYRRWREKRNSDPLKVKSRRAGKLAARHLASAEQQLSAGNTRAFYENVFRGLYGYLSDKLHLSAAGLNKESVSEALLARGVNAEIISRLVSALDLCEMARFAPVTGIAAGDVLEKAKGIIYEIEGSL